MVFERMQVWRGGLLRLRIYMPFVLVAAALAAGGCGGGSSDARSAEPLPNSASSPRSQLIARADAICRRLNTKIAAHKPANLGLAEIARGAPRNAAFEKTALEELRKLTPPASMARDWRRMIAYRILLMEELVELGRYAKAKDARGIKTLTASKKRLHGKLFTTATHGGFKVCPQIG